MLAGRHHRRICVGAALCGELSVKALGVQLLQSMAVLADAKLEPELVVVNMAVCERELLPHIALVVVL